MIKGPSLAPRINGAVRKLIGAMVCLSRKLKSLVPLTEDMIYKVEFASKYTYDFFGKHVMQNYKNCVFCSNLKKTGSQRQLHSCSKGVYNFPGQLLPDTLCSDGELEEHGAIAKVPWFYRNPCPYFKRLNRGNYLRNFKHPFSDKTVANYEILEGIEYGLSSNRKPCYICASLDYSIFRNCLADSEHTSSHPCDKIANIVESKYSLH